MRLGMPRVRDTEELGTPPGWERVHCIRRNQAGSSSSLESKAFLILVLERILQVSQPAPTNAQTHLHRTLNRGDPAIWNTCGLGKLLL